jgi:hypothetical protein
MFESVEDRRGDETDQVPAAQAPRAQAAQEVQVQHPAHATPEVGDCVLASSSLWAAHAALTESRSFSVSFNGASPFLPRAIHFCSLFKSFSVTFFPPSVRVAIILRANLNFEIVLSAGAANVGADPANTTPDKPAAANSATVFANFLLEIFFSIWSSSSLLG